ncbi:unnamed protein product [Nesidiocoris tenuis]|uniref:Uncharacterized protein n=1 Tax=Nesidiocoris tenuis TaxID=355587 RepID=A0A6H5HNM2_9HEMI|nr:unnamed protein product [Nesidiocoris tenuis]
MICDIFQYFGLKLGDQYSLRLYRKSYPKSDRSDRIDCGPVDKFGTGKDGVPDLVLDAVRARQLVRMSKISKKANVMNEVSGRMPTSKTADDIHAINNIPMRYFSIGLPKIKASWTDRKRPEDSKKLWFNTICDPKYPLYKSNGLPASYSLFSQSNVGSSLVPNGTGKTKKNYRDLSNERPAKRESRQLSLSLSKYSERPPPKDAPLTPLMAKMALCIVADEISESFIADEVTESVDNPFSVVENGSSSEPSSLLLGLSVAKEAPEKSVDLSSMASQHSMFVYGRNSTYVVLVLKKSAEISSNLVDSLWETADEYLKKVDDELDKVVEETSSSWCSGAEVSSAGEYSYAVVDGNWGPVERGGFYRPHQIQMVTCLHETLLSLPQVVDILVRAPSRNNSENNSDKIGIVKPHLANHLSIFDPWKWDDPKTPIFISGMTEDAKKTSARKTLAPVLALRKVQVKNSIAISARAFNLLKRSASFKLKIL